MPVDISHVDLVSLIEQKTGHRYGEPTGRDRTCKGPCPWCGGTDRFAIFTLENHYHCGIHGSNGCGRHGDAIDFLKEYEGRTFIEACEALGVDPGSYVPFERLIKPWSPDIPPNNKWRETGDAFVYTCERYLWSEKGQDALAYLKSRGLTEGCLRAMHIGYSPMWVTAGDINTLEQWGFTGNPEVAAQGKYILMPKEVEKIKLPEGIVIPHYVKGVLWKINVRRLRYFSKETAEQRKKRKYRAITGSATCLYNADAIQPGQPLLMTESEFDALSAMQVCGDLAAYVATGSTSGARGLQWAAEIALASHVLIAFDKDEEEQGLQAAREWANILKEKATIWQPSGGAKDVNEMLVNGQDIRQWVELGLSIPDVSGVLLSLPQVEENDERPISFRERPCVHCGSHEARKRDDGIWLCLCYWQNLERKPAGE